MPTRLSALSSFQRDGIYRWTFDGRSAEEIYVEFFGSKHVTLLYIKNRMSFFRKAPVDEIIDYLAPKDNQSIKLGRKRQFDAGDDILVKVAMDSTNTKRLWSILQTFAAMKGIDPDSTSVSSIYRAQVRLRYSLKTLNRLHVRQNPIEALNFFKSVEHIHEDFILNFDAASSESGENFKERKGRAPIGEDAIKREFIIKGEPWCFVALYSTVGFLSWHFFKGTGVDNVAMVHFLRHQLRPFFTPGSCVICDNASNNKHENTVRELDLITLGSYKFNAPYWHIYAPIERGFSNVMREVRLTEDDAMINVVAVVEAAFMKYSVLGTHGHVAREHFSAYSRNHQNWLDDITVAAYKEVHIRAQEDC